MSDTGIYATLIVALKYAVLFVIPFVEPQLAGILGGIAYLIVRHELNLAFMKSSSILVVMFFGWLGAWATVNIIAEHYPELPHVWEHILSASMGFLSYDIMLSIGSNTKSIIGFFTDVLKSIIKNGVDKWNS